MEVTHDLERLLMTKSQPTVAMIVSRYARHGTLTEQDAEDVAATVNLKLLQKMRHANRATQEDVASLEDYVAKVTYNVINDHLRSRYPAKARLKNRLRYVLSHDARLLLSMTAEGYACALRYRPPAKVVASTILDSVTITPVMRNTRKPGDALVAILTAIERPVLFDALVSFTAKLWNVVDPIGVEISRIPSQRHISADPIEMRQFLRVVWREIQKLRPMQRKALLLNLRDEGPADAISLLVLTGTARFTELALALEMSEETLAAMWHQLPLDDLQIGGMLKVTRQQVINLRKSARARLVRRMAS